MSLFVKMSFDEKEREKQTWKQGEREREGEKSKKRTIVSTPSLGVCLWLFDASNPQVLDIKIDSRTNFELVALVELYDLFYPFSP